MTATKCGCSEFTASRRSFLKGLTAAAGAGVLTTMPGGAFSQIALGGTATGNVVVILSLRGGADGLSLAVPYGDPAYAAARPHLAIPTNALLAKDGFFGLHPCFAPLMPMWNQGKMAAIHAVGLPQPTRSHFDAMEKLEDADPGTSARVGWINRLVGLETTPDPNHAMQMGNITVPTSLYGPNETMAARSIDLMTVPGRSDPVGATQRRNSLERIWNRNTTVLGRGAHAALTAVDEFAPYVGTGTSPQNGAIYPGGDLGVALREAARLIRTSVPVKMITIDAGSWDMHVDVGTATDGDLFRAVTELAKGVAAFFTDLGVDGDRVTVATISEFGRRVEENSSFGLDHGYGNAMFLLGAGVRGGRYFGQWPGLAAGQRVQGDLAVTRDYRSVLTEVLRSRFSANTSVVFPNFLPETIGAMV